MKGERDEESDDDRSEEEEELFSKSSIVGVLGPPVQVLPEGDHGARGGLPPYVAEPKEEDQGEGGSGLSMGLEVLDEAYRCTGVDIVPILRSSRPRDRQVLSSSSEWTRERKPEMTIRTPLRAAKRTNPDVTIRAGWTEWSISWEE
jgi:hypothetical protein